MGAYPVFGLGVSFLLNMVSPLPILLVGLSQGVTGILPALIGGVLVSLGIWGWNFTLVYLLIQGLPVGVVVHYSLLHRQKGRKTQWYPENLLLEKGVFLALGVLVISGFSHWMGGGVDEEKVGKILEKIYGHGAYDKKKAMMALHMMTHFMPVFLSFSWILNMGINIALAQRILQRVGANLRPSFSGQVLILPNRLLYLLASVSVGALLSSGTAKILFSSLALVIGCGYFISGLTVGHRYCSSFKNKRLAYLCFYMGIFIFIWPLSLVALTGLLSPWLGPWVEREIALKKEGKF